MARKLCEHNKRIATCNICRTGSAFCTHDKYKHSCNICNPPCEHGRYKKTCRECGAPPKNNKCTHGGIKYNCITCLDEGVGGSQRCEHKKIKYICAICSPLQHLAYVVRRRIRQALTRASYIKTGKTIEYIGCDIPTLRAHLESQFTSYMSWSNYGTYWHIDHKIPLMYDKDNVTRDTIVSRMHYTNLQPLEASDNLSKGNRLKTIDHTISNHIV